MAGPDLFGPTATVLEAHAYPSSSLILDDFVGIEAMAIDAFASLLQSVAAFFSRARLAWTR